MFAYNNTLCRTQSQMLEWHSMGPREQVSSNLGEKLKQTFNIYAFEYRIVHLINLPMAICAQSHQTTT